MEILRNITARASRETDLDLVCGVTVHFTAWVEGDKAFGRYDLSPSTELKVRAGVYASEGLSASAFERGFSRQRGKDMPLSEMVLGLGFDSESSPYTKHPTNLASGQLAECRSWLVPVFAEATNYIDMDRVSSLKRKDKVFSRENIDWLHHLCCEMCSLYVYHSSPRRFYVKNPGGRYNDMVDFVKRSPGSFATQNLWRGMNDATAEYLKSKIKVD